MNSTCNARTRARYSKVKLSPALPPLSTCTPWRAAPPGAAPVAKASKIGQPKVALLSRYENTYQDREVLHEEGLVGVIVSKQLLFVTNALYRAYAPLSIIHLDFVLRRNRLAYQDPNRLPIVSINNSLTSRVLVLCDFLPGNGF